MRWEVLRLEEQISQVEKRLEWAVDRDDEATQTRLEQQLEALELHLAKLQGGVKIEVAEGEAAPESED